MQLYVFCNNCLSYEGTSNKTTSIDENFPTESKFLCAENQTQNNSEKREKNKNYPVIEFILVASEQSAGRFEYAKTFSLEPTSHYCARTNVLKTQCK